MPGEKEKASASAENMQKWIGICVRRVYYIPIGNAVKPAFRRLKAAEAKEKAWRTSRHSE
jgi:hypothetical protein